MNHIKKNAALVLAVLLCFSLMLSACGGQQAGSTPSGELSYQVTVKDALGNPYADGVIVRFMSGTEQAAMQVVDASGVASKALAAGDYTVELMFTGDASEYYYDQSDLTLSADKTELEITLVHTPAAEPRTLYVSGEEHLAYPVAVGGTYVSLTPGQRNYFLFTPSAAGTYEVSVVEEVDSIGYYGAPHFVQAESAAEVVDNAFTISVSTSMIGTGDTGTTVLVIGVDAGELENCTLTIQRIGEAERTLADEPWTIYQTTAELAPYTLPAGASIREFDLTASTDTYKLVYNEEDGFYHLDSEDGPLILVRLGVDPKYLDCFKTILDHTGVNTYFFDENGDFVKKESYSECLLEYFEYMDEDNGVYPLTEDLKYIIQTEGEDSGWFDPTNSVYLFQDENRVPIENINNEISWLFMCCYIA